MPYQLPEVPDTEPKTFDEYQEVLRKLESVQHDRSWLTVCCVLAGDFDLAKLAAQQAADVQQAAAAYINRWYPVTNRLIDEKYKLIEEKYNL